MNKVYDATRTNDGHAFCLERHPEIGPDGLPMTYGTAEHPMHPRKYEFDDPNIDRRNCRCYPHTWIYMPSPPYSCALPWCKRIITPLTPKIGECPNVNDYRANPNDPIPHTWLVAYRLYTMRIGARKMQMQRLRIGPNHFCCNEHYLTAKANPDVEANAFRDEQKAITFTIDDQVVMGLMKCLSAVEEKVCRCKHAIKELGPFYVDCATYQAKIVSVVMDVRKANPNAGQSRGCQDAIKPKVVETELEELKFDPEGPEVPTMPELPAGPTETTTTE